MLKKAIELSKKEGKSNFGKENKNNSSSGKSSSGRKSEAKDYWPSVNLSGMGSILTVSFKALKEELGGLKGFSSVNENLDSGFEALYNYGDEDYGNGTLKADESEAQENLDDVSMGWEPTKILD